MRNIIGSKRVSNFLTSRCSAKARSCDPFSGNFSRLSCVWSSLEFSSPTAYGQPFSFSDMLAVQKSYRRKVTRDLSWCRGEGVGPRRSALACMEKAGTRASYLGTGSLLRECEARAWALLIGDASEARFSARP